MKKLLLLFTFLSYNAFAQNCDSLIIIYTTIHINYGAPVVFSSVEIDSLKNGLIMSRNFNNSRITNTYDSQNRLHSRVSIPDSNVFSYDINSNLVSIDYYRYTNNQWEYRSDTSHIDYHYSGHGLDSVFMFAWDGSSMNSFYRQHLYYNTGDTLFKKQSEIFDSIQWVVDSVTSVTYGFFTPDYYRIDTVFLDSISPSTAAEVQYYDSLGRILTRIDIHLGFEYEVEYFAYECNHLAHWESTWYGAHSGSFMNIFIFDSQCRIKKKAYGHYSEVNEYDYFIDQYYYVGCSTLAVTTSEDVIMCSGDSTEISAMHFGGIGPFNVQWLPSLGLACDTCLSTLACPDETTTYTMFVTDSSGRTSSNFVVVTLVNRPFANSFIASIDTNSACQSAVLAADSISGYGFGWYRDNIFFGYGSHIPITFNGEYVVKIDLNAVCPSAFDTLVFNYFTRTPPTVTLTRGCYEAYATLTGSSHIQWYFNNQLIVDSIRDTLVFSNEGLYSATAIDSSGCSSSVARIYYAELSVTSEAHPTCKNSCSGYIKLNPWYYDYVWSNGDSTEMARFLCQGIYSVVATGEFGCTLTLTDTVEVFPEIDLNYLTTGTSGPSACDAIVIPVDTSNTPYNAYYIWENNSNDRMMDSLCAGWHTVKVRPPFSFCQQIDSFFVPSSLSNDTCSILESHTNMSCNGFTDGKITVGCSTGSPFACYWDTSFYDAHRLYQRNLNAGIYTCVLIDQNGCVDSVQVTITEPPPLGISFNIYQSFCGDSCVLTAIGSGGTPPYSYRWCDFTNGSQLISCEEECSIYMQDSKFCFMRDTLIQDPVSPIIFHTIDNPPSCPTCNDGSIIIIASGGIPPYYYSVDNSAPTFNDTITNLSAGTHIICVSNSNGCNTCSSAEIPMSIESITSENQISFSPNPVHDRATFIFAGFISHDQTNFLIYDALGRLVKNISVVAQQFEFNRESLPAGIYTFVLKSQKTNRERGKIVID